MEFETYVNDEPINYYLHDGLFEEYNRDCTLSITGSVKNHRRIGVWTWFKKNKIKKQTVNYLDSITIISINYFESGRIKDSCRFYNRKQDGVCKFWYENGNIDRICNWKNGQQDSTSIYFYENGKIKEIDFWKMGKVHGEALLYYKNGNLHKRRKYIEGQQKEEVVFDNKGKEIK